MKIKWKLSITSLLLIPETGLAETVTQTMMMYLDVIFTNLSRVKTLVLNRGFKLNHYLHLNLNAV